jgi:uncharacterized protein YndB with AHSA1/START domain
MQQLVMTRRIDLPVARVFAAWCDPLLIRRWFAPGDMHVPEAQADARPGGRYRIVMQEPDGKQHIVGGEYLDIQKDRRLEFTWQWEGSEATTRVRIDLQSLDAGSTELTLTHDGFATTEARDNHQKGWTGCLAKLGPDLADRAA